MSHERGWRLEEGYWERGKACCSFLEMVQEVSTHADDLCWTSDRRKHCNLVKVEDSLRTLFRVSSLLLRRFNRLICFSLTFGILQKTQYWFKTLRGAQLSKARRVDHYSDAVFGRLLLKPYQSHVLATQTSRPPFESVVM